MAIPLWKLLMRGFGSLIFQPSPGTGGSVSARYCYSVFMRHRIIAAQHGLNITPKRVLEIGPGDSLGVGLMALLTGSEQYIAIDVVCHASPRRNIDVLDNLVKLLESKSPIPSDGECAEILPILASYEFPHTLFEQVDFTKTLAPRRLNRIRAELLGTVSNEMIQYVAPMGKMEEVKKENIDWILSQAVLEHIDDLEEVYAGCFRHLTPNGIMTHQIDYQCHETAKEWNGHWKYSSWLWAIMRGRLPWFVNRKPHSTHQKLLSNAGFLICREYLEKRTSQLAANQLSRDYSSLSVSDLTTAGAMLVSKKKEGTVTLSSSRERAVHA